MTGGAGSLVLAALTQHAGHPELLIRADAIALAQYRMARALYLSRAKTDPSFLPDYDPPDFTDLTTSWLADCHAAAILSTPAPRK